MDLPSLDRVAAGMRLSFIFDDAMRCETASDVVGTSHVRREIRGNGIGKIER
jgi:hypothetical protein